MGCIYQAMEGWPLFCLTNYVSCPVGGGGGGVDREDAM